MLSGGPQAWVALRWGLQWSASLMATEGHQGHRISGPGGQHNWYPPLRPPPGEPQGRVLKNTPDASPSASQPCRNKALRGQELEDGSVHTEGHQLGPEATSGGGAMPDPSKKPFLSSDGDLSGDLMGSRRLKSTRSGGHISQM